jgi:hypothetical protein
LCSNATPLVDDRASMGYRSPREYIMLSSQPAAGPV